MSHVQSHRYSQDKVVHDLDHGPRVQITWQATQIDRTEPTLRSH